MSAILDRRIRQCVAICREQLGFQEGCGTRDNVFVLQELIQKHRKSGLYVCFVDFKMAFDSVDQQLLFDKIALLPGMDPVWIRMLRAMYTGVRACVKGGSVWFPETIGVKQGDPLSPLLFLLYLHDLPDALFPPGSADRVHAPALAKSIIRCLLYADDLALPALSETGLQAVMGRLEAYCKRWKLTVNVPKPKVVVFHGSKQAAPLSSFSFVYNGKPVECVPKFKYVGVWFHQSGLVSDSFSDILSASRRAMYACTGRLTRLGPVPVSLKVALFNAYVRPVMLYCAEALPYTNTQAAALDSIQLQYIRWSLGQLGKSSPSTDTLAEVGQKPISYDVTRSRINYYLLVKSRPQTHITMAPLHEAMTTQRKQTNWWIRVQQAMSTWKLDHWHTATQLDISLRSGKRGKSVIAAATKTACWTAWYQHVRGETPH